MVHVNTGFKWTDCMTPQLWHKPTRPRCGAGARCLFSHVLPRHENSGWFKLAKVFEDALDAVFGCFFIWCLQLGWEIETARNSGKGCLMMPQFLLQLHNRQSQLRWLIHLSTRHDCIRRALILGMPVEHNVTQLMASECFTEHIWFPKLGDPQSPWFSIIKWSHGGPPHVRKLPSGSVSKLAPMIYATSSNIASCRLSGTERIFSVLATMGITAKASWFRGKKETAL